MQTKDAKALLEKYRSGTCSDEERALVESWYHQMEVNDFDLSTEDLDVIRANSWKRLNVHKEERKLSFAWIKYAAAAIAFALITWSILFFNRDADQQLIHQNAKAVNDKEVAPGGNKATLTLSDGTTIDLDDQANGQIAKVPGIKISKSASGLIIYEVESGENDIKGSFNQITTPRGGQYQVLLPDGTKVWLNASSSLKYPLVFTPKERRVELKGEAYFEVSPKYSSNGSRISFVVGTSTQTIEVLGTHFNVNAYPDEKAVKTTLLEGSVRVNVNSGTKDGLVLKPNQQSVLSASNFYVAEVNADESISWKNGYFSFEQADLTTVMMQLSRWYDVDVEFRGKIPKGIFTGKVPRNMSLSKVLEILAFTDVNFKMENKKMIILPK